MLPKVEADFEANFNPKTYPSFDWRLDPVKQEVRGTREGLDAVRQAIYFILNTERYDHIIYSWDYGIELRELFGMPVDWVVAEIERRVIEALTMDERILSVHSFLFDISERHIVRTQFTVITNFGEIKEELEVSY